MENTVSTEDLKGKLDRTESIKVTAFFKEGHDEGWRHYVVCFERPEAGMLIMNQQF
jgi:hypothetical protein